MTDAAARIAGVFVCPGCGGPSAFGRQCGRPSCAKASALDGIVSMASYRQPALRKLLHAYKYEGIDEAGEALASLFRRFLCAHGGMFAAMAGGARVLAVPAHPLRRASRGFDHCRPFVDAIGSCLGLAEAPRVLVKRYRMKTQASIGPEDARRLNAAGSVACRMPGAEGAYVIFDDVATTGATLHECAKALKTAGAGEVWALTLLRG